MEIKDLESKIWFRFLKVIFIFAYLATSLAVLVFAYSSKPYTTNDEYNSKIVCDNGKEYKAGDVGIDIYSALAEQLGGFSVGNAPWETGTGVGVTPAKDKATKLCQSFSERQLGFIPDVPPYKVELVKKTVGNWWSFIGYTALALFIAVVIFELIKRSFFYIAIGKKFLR